MKLDFAANTRRNIIASFVNKFVGMFFPFLRKTLFLWVLGPGYLGLNGLLYSILGMLMLAELGFGTAIVCYMYKPVADDDNDLLCAYLRLFRTVYRWVGTAIFAAGLCLLPFLRHLIHGEIPADVNLHLVYMLHLINTSASYFLFAYRGSVLSAHHRNDVYNYIHTGTSIAEFAVVTVVLYLFSILMLFTERQVTCNGLIYIVSAVSISMALCYVKKSRLVDIVIVILMLAVLANQYLPLFGIEI